MSIVIGGDRARPLAAVLACSVALAATAGAPAQERTGTATHPFDGRWSVRLVCEDTKDANGVVKGYEYAFEAVISEGAVNGRYESARTAAHVTFTGTVAADGTLAIRAVGNTGRREYSVGRTAEGSPYQYTMQGRLNGNVGEAKRQELRPCTAHFSRP
jgi:hypothetical protein